ncbi:cuticle protein CP14.6-like [Ostrinia furnacalis]|uniref:cuticle protein CP14.6-like n=1 Tax=Ostrinia furnacalis TaxID=93504 RepID=UPI00103C3BFD|nr:cuticle protein CP14.6-like [Ostrinia furnacalis]
MKSFVAVLALVALAAADVAHLQRGADADAQIVKQEADVGPESFQYSYQTSNGIAGQESGALKNVGSEAEAISVQGSNQYTAPGGEVISLTYTADENGYQPQGAHLPTPPAPEAIPEYIVRSIKYNAEHAAREASPQSAYKARF